MPRTKRKTKPKARRRRASYPKGYKRVSDATLAADRKKHPSKFPASLVRRKVENAEKRASRRKGQMNLFG